MTIKLWSHTFLVFLVTCVDMLFTQYICYSHTLWWIPTWCFGLQFWRFVLLTQADCTLGIYFQRCWLLGVQIFGNHDFMRWIGLLDYTISCGLCNAKSAITLSEVLIGWLDTFGHPHPLTPFRYGIEGTLSNHLCIFMTSPMQHLHPLHILIGQLSVEVRKKQGFEVVFFHIWHYFCPSLLEQHYRCLLQETCAP